MHIPIGRVPAGVLAGAFACTLLAAGGCAADRVTTSAQAGDAGSVRLEIVSGNGQQAPPGAELPQPLVVRALNAAGTPIANQIINFRVTAGGGSVFAGTAKTNSNGYAREWWTLGPQPGTNRVEARAVHAGTGERLVFGVFEATATTTPTPVVGSVTVTPAADTIEVGGTVQLAATVRDAGGGVMSGATVAWSSTNGAVASVSSSGLVTGAAAGAAIVIAESGGKSDSAVITVAAAPPPPAGPLAVFPGAEGFGTTTPAGRGGQVIRVTNLSDAGPGSLRAALTAPGPRIVVFDVAGTITLSDYAIISEPFVTVAGQTAPSPGITLRGAGLDIRTHDVLVQHLRIRVGDAASGPNPENRDAFQILGPGAYNVVIDHVSASWSTDEVGSTWYPLRDVTIRHSIISEGLNRSIHPEGAHSTGVLVGDNSDRVAIIGNLFAHNYDRNPQAKGNTHTVIVNNLIYNSGYYAVRLSDPDNSGALSSSVVGNVMVTGPSSVNDYLVSVSSTVKPGTRVYVRDNIAPTELRVSSGLSFDPITSSAPLWPSALSVRPASGVEQWVLAGAGARPADRDAVDARVVNEVRTRTGRIIDSQNDVGGWPALAPTTRVLALPANPGGDDDGDGYTNLEEWLHRLAAEVEGRPAP
ncbi:MAG TPA: Ig-like domain-containing protein [Gemmatimonadaceae bacterium]|nr:Ig-like domain-containing protein [Gemmatimonadaceae bacterium]